MYKLVKNKKEFDPITDRYTNERVTLLSELLNVKKEHIKPMYYNKCRLSTKDGYVNVIRKEELERQLYYHADTIIYQTKITISEAEKLLEIKKKEWEKWYNFETESFMIWDEDFPHYNKLYNYIIEKKEHTELLKKAIKCETLLELGEYFVFLDKNTQKSLLKNQLKKTD